jgi:peptidase E
MKYYLLSGMDEKNDYNFYPDIAKIFKNELKSFNTIVYIPTYPDNKEKCEKLSKSEKFKNIGINFDKSIVLNNYYSANEIQEIISKNELFFLYGGNPYKQIEFIEKYNIAKMIKNKVVIGLSAGSINMCKKSICTQDEDFEESSLYQGMGLVNFSIEPHFDYNNKTVLKDLKEFSKKTDIYALEDDAYIIIEDNTTNFYRKYLFDSKWRNKNVSKLISLL